MKIKREALLLPAVALAGIIVIWGLIETLSHTTPSFKNKKHADRLVEMYPSLQIKYDIFYADECFDYAELKGLKRLAIEESDNINKEIK